MMIFDAGKGYGTRLLIAGALVFWSGESQAAEPSFAGATVTPAQLRRVEAARVRGVWDAQTGSTVAARTRRPEPAQTKEAD